ncbi:hypothetical protein AALA00_06475 [Lachnospiraceae bacterium 46-15]
MKKNMTISKKIAGGALSMVMACSLAAGNPLCASTAYAETAVEFNDEYSDSWVVTPVQDDNYTGQAYMQIDAVEEGAKVKKLKSSNKKVATVKADSSGLVISYGLQTGSTTISCVVNGVKLSHKFTVKYICPLSGFKVDGKSVLSTLKKKNVFVTSQTLENKRVVIKAKKGWVITQVTNVKNSKSRTAAVKNKTSYSTSITTKWPYDGIRVKLKNKKNGKEQIITYRKMYDSSYSVAG